MIDRTRNILRLSAQIVAAHAGHNEIQPHALSDIIHSVYNTLVDLSGSDDPTFPALDGAEPNHHHGEHNHVHGVQDHTIPQPAQDQSAYVHPVYGQTVFHDRLVCMEDGLSMKMLKRHLLTVHGMTPGEYRAKWDLPDNYPMVAPQYAKLRSNLAVQSGLGLKPQNRPARGRR